MPSEKRAEGRREQEPGSRGARESEESETVNRDSMHCGDSMAIGLAVVFQDPRVYLGEFIFASSREVI